MENKESLGHSLWTISEKTKDPDKIVDFPKI